MTPILPPASCILPLPSCLLHPAPSILQVLARLPTHPNATYGTRPLAQVRRTVIHHSVTECPGTSSNDEVTHLQNIARGHIRIAAWPGIAYHYCIFPTGRIYQVNHLWTQSYHVGNYNATSVGLCLIGKLHKTPPTTDQLQAARDLVAALGWPAVPHKALHQTACPGNWAAWGPFVKGDS
jgi:N-acetyl-anhydromuramyl-L-alanine amidase AmpD